MHYVRKETLTLCPIFRRAATITDVQTPEPLVAKLPCLCPCCEIVLGADELREHFAGCVLIDGSTGSDIPAASCASTCPASATKMLSKLQNSHGEQDSKQSAISVQPSKETSVLTPDCPDSAPQKTSRASQYETRLATTDECRRQSVKPATYPIESACYILQFYPSARGDSVQIYRTLPVYLGNVGFYFAAHKSTRNVGMWFLYFDIGQQQSNTIKLTWKVTIWCGQEVQGEGRSATVRNPQIGHHVHFSSVFDSYEREMAIITVRIEKLSWWLCIDKANVPDRGQFVVDSNFKVD